MKKLLSLCLMLLLCVSMVSCGKNLEDAPKDESLSGTNAAVSKIETAKNVEYLFEGFLTTKLPAGTIGSDASINTDSTLFSFSKENVVFFDVSINSEGTSREAVLAKVNESLTFSSASSAGTITIDNVKFYGVNRPDFGYTEFSAHKSGYDITVKVYADMKDDVIKSFIKHTEFLF